ncbi:MAG TPA: hypothetical protein VFM88_23210 [Vicinamibacteria bacterium]|nr:hypothetical protein [Vicinamibacteria bacterium]
MNWRPQAARTVWISVSGRARAASQKRRCSASWARLIAKVFQADPLTCRQCGGKLKIVAYLHDQVAIRRS